MKIKKFNLLYNFWRFLGLYTFYYDKKKNGRFSYIVFFFGVFHISWSLPLCIWNLWSDIIADCKNSIRASNTTTTVVTCCDILSLVLATLVSLTFASIKFNQFADINTRLLEVRNKLGPTKSFLRVEQIGFCLIFLHIALLLIDVAASFDYLIMFLPNYIFHMIIFNVEVQVFTIALKIKFLFKILNNKIASALMNKKLLFNNVLPPMDLIAGKKDATLSEVMDYSEIHWSICNVIDLFNSAFGIQLSAIFLSIFLHIIVTPFFIFITLSQNGENFSTPVLILNIFWVIAHSSQLYIIIWPCSTAKVEGRRTSRIICKYLSKDLPQDLRKQCDLFLLQLVHHDTNFSVSGLFKLDLPVITNIVGAISTYLVILIQFQSSSLECE